MTTILHLTKPLIEALESYEEKITVYNEILLDSETVDGIPLNAIIDKALVIKELKVKIVELLKQLEATT